MKSDQIKRIYVVSIIGGIILLLITFALLTINTNRSSATETTNTPFTLDDKNGTYILSQTNDNYVLTYTSSTGQIEQIYVDSISIQPYKEYIGQPIHVKGYLKTEYKTVQCIKAPCDPIQMDIFVIEKVSR